MTNAARGLLLFACATLTGGCASSLSGLGGTASYACKAPEGVLCTSVSGVYANSLRNNLPAQRTEREERGSATAEVRAARSGAEAAMDAASIRSAPRVLRVWIAPWEDSDGDLQDQSYVYVVVDPGRWLIEHRRASIRNEFTPVAAPRAAAQTGSDATQPGSAAIAPLPRPGDPSQPSRPGLQQPRDEHDVERALH